MADWLITGADGFIGTNLLNYLRSKGETSIIPIDLPINLLDSVQINSLDNHSTIVHLAAETEVRLSILKPRSTFINNCLMTINVLEIAKQNNSKIIFTSSAGASDPTNPYSASKLACEAICRAYRESYSMNVVILRLSNVYGPHSIFKNSVIPKFIKSIISNRPVKIYGDGSQVRDFIHVTDVCKQIYEAEKDLTISTGRLTSINRIAEILGATNIKHTDPIPGELTTVSCYNEIDTSVDLGTGLYETLKWFRENVKIDN